METGRLTVAGLAASYPVTVEQYPESVSGEAQEGGHRYAATATMLACKFLKVKAGVL